MSDIHACRRKIRYATCSAARRGHQGMSYYRCPVCEGWHVATPFWHREILRLLDEALGTQILPLTHGAAGDPRTGRAFSRLMKQAGATPLHP